MTYKLIALMTVVLLLSLGASAVLMDHYRDQVMEEVASTVSDVGRATLRTFDFGQSYSVHTARGLGASGDVTLDLHPVNPSLVAIERIGKGAGQPEVEFIGEARTTDGFVVIAYETENIDSLPAAVQIEQQVRVTSEPGGEGPQVQRKVRMVRLDDVRTEEDPEGLTLRIPTVQTDKLTADRIKIDWVSAKHPHDEFIAAGDPGVLQREDVLLKVPTADYQHLFDTARNRSTMMFLGVFLVGTVLSAGLASRFTRPVRRLDIAIRRLSEGDLDARVPARGSDEVARLGRAFNSMAQSLRANRQRAAELTRRERLSALGRLAAGVAHDVRNPLHSVNLTLQHLQETCRPEDSGKEAEFDRAVSLIRGEVGRLDRLVENFLRFARTDRRERIPVDLGKLAGETVRLVEQEAQRRGISIRVKAPELLPSVSLDVESIRSSILNLVLNGFEAMPHGGRLELEVAPHDGHIDVSVADTGRGISEEDQERVFDFAYTTREGGSGLGLAMVHQVVVDEHGGEVKLDSRLGEGTRITLSLPVSGEATT